MTVGLHLFEVGEDWVHWVVAETPDAARLLVAEARGWSIEDLSFYTDEDTAAAVVLGDVLILPLQEGDTMLSSAWWSSTAERSSPGYVANNETHFLTRVQPG